MATRTVRVVAGAHRSHNRDCDSGPTICFCLYGVPMPVSRFIISERPRKKSQPSPNRYCVPPFTLIWGI